MSQIQESNGATRVFWFISSTSGFVLLYIAAITFIPIPKGNERFVDIALAFLMGTVLGGGMSYYVGASPSRRIDSSSNVTGDTVNINTNTPPNEHNNKEKE